MTQGFENLPEKLRPDKVSYFDAFARYYDQELKEQGIPEKLDELVRWAVGLTDKSDAESALDMGAGTGIIIDAIKKYADPKRIVAVDSSAGMLAYLLRKHPDGDVSIINENLQDYTVDSSETFDLITCLTVLEFLPDAPEAISNAGRLLNEGGTLAFSYVPREEGETRQRFVDDSGSLIARTVMEYHWRPEEIEHAVTDSGLTIVGRIEGLRTQEYDEKTNTAERNNNFVVAVKPNLPHH